MIYTKLFKGKQKSPTVQTASVTRSVKTFSDSGGYLLYKRLMDSVPVINASVRKLQRLIGSFVAEGESEEATRALSRFLSEVNVNGNSRGIDSFVSSCFEQLLVYGTSISEIVLTGDGFDIAALYNADLRDVRLKQGESPLDVKIFRNEKGTLCPVQYLELVSISALNPERNSVYGTSLLKTLPFVSDVLMQIYRTIGVNWERVGNVRFAVSYKPSGDIVERANAKENAEIIAQEWRNAMQSGSVSDFVTVGDVSIKVIGADNQILDSSVPVRQLLEQIVAVMGIPPYLLGFSWSSTERMSSQQSDILTSELESYRRLLTPTITKICRLWLTLNGYGDSVSISWDDITLQDSVELAEARLKNAQAKQIEIKTEGEANGK